MSDEFKAERILSVPGSPDYPGGYSMPRRRGYQAYGAAAKPPQAVEEHDVALILGLNPSSLAPELIKAMQSLLSQTAELRTQLDGAEVLRRHLEDKMDHYPGLALLNGHAFIRELDALLVEDASGWQIASAEVIKGQLALLHIDGLDHAVCQYGIESGNALLLQISQIIQAYAQTGEPMAFLGFGSFCWLMLDPDLQLAQERLKRTLEALWQAPWPYPVTLSVTFGVVPLVSSRSAQESLRAAEQERLNSSQSR